VYLKLDLKSLKPHVKRDIKPEFFLKIEFFFKTGSSLSGFFTAILSADEEEPHGEGIYTLKLFTVKKVEPNREELSTYFDVRQTLVFTEWNAHRIYPLRNVRPFINFSRIVDQYHGIQIGYRDGPPCSDKVDTHRGMWGT